MTATDLSSTRSAGSRSHAPVTPYDVRATETVGRDLVRNLSAVHELYARRTSTTWGGRLGAVVKMDEVAVDQATYDDFVSSMPTPNVLALVAIDPLPQPVVIELSNELALTLVTRLLGGGLTGGQPGGSRRLTDVETNVLGHLLEDTVTALADALHPLGATGGRLLHVEHNPQLAQVVAPGDRVVLLTYDVVLSQGARGSGLLTLCYPHDAVLPLFEALQAQQATAGPADATAPTDPEIRRRVEEVPLDLRARLRSGPVRARDLAGLQPGDVLQLEHRAGEPAIVTTGGLTVCEAHLGQRGRRRALQLATAPSEVLPAADLLPDVARTPAASPHLPDPVDPQDTADVA